MFNSTTLLVIASLLLEQIFAICPKQQRRAQELAAENAKHGDAPYTGHPPNSNCPLAKAQDHYPYSNCPLSR